MTAVSGCPPFPSRQLGGHSGVQVGFNGSLRPAVSCKCVATHLHLMQSRCRMRCDGEGKTRLEAQVRCRQATAVNLLSPSTALQEPWLTLSAPGECFESTEHSG